MANYICYYRVSTRKQGLGLDAQRAACTQHVNAKGGNIIAEYSEKESGKNDHRPQMEKAIDHANRVGAIFLVAKLDRLSRSKHLFGADEIISRIDQIEVCDLPQLNTLTKGIFLTLASYEREMCSKRTREALAVKKAQGIQLGAPNATFTDEMRAKAKAVRKANADGKSKQYLDLIRYYRKEGMTLQAIADNLNAKGFKTPRGKAFAPATITMYLKRL